MAIERKQAILEGTYSEKESSQFKGPVFLLGG